MAEHHLEIAEVDVAIESEGRERVPKQVDPGGKAQSPLVFCEGLVESAAREGPAGAGAEQS